MITTVTNRPQLYTQAWGPIVYGFFSDQANQIDMKYVIDVYLDDVKVSRLKQFPNPEGYCLVDVQSVVQGYIDASDSVNYEVNPTTGWKKLELQSKRLIVKVGEEYRLSPGSPLQIYNGLSNVVGNPAFIISNRFQAGMTSSGPVHVLPAAANYEVAYTHQNLGPTSTYPAGMFSEYTMPSSVGGLTSSNAGLGKFLTGLTNHELFIEDSMTLTFLNFNPNEPTLRNQYPYAAKFDAIIDPQYAKVEIVTAGEGYFADEGIFLYDKTTGNINAYSKLVSLGTGATTIGASASSMNLNYNFNFNNFVNLSNLKRGGAGESSFRMFNDGSLYSTGKGNTWLLGRGSTYDETTFQLIGSTFIGAHLMQIPSETGNNTNNDTVAVFNNVAALSKGASSQGVVYLWGDGNRFGLPDEQFFTGVPSATPQKFTGPFEATGGSCMIVDISSIISGGNDTLIVAGTYNSSAPVSTTGMYVFGAGDNTFSQIGGATVDSGTKYRSFSPSSYSIYLDGTFVSVGATYTFYPIYPTDVSTNGQSSAFITIEDGIDPTMSSIIRNTSLYVCGYNYPELTGLTASQISWTRIPSSIISASLVSDDEDFAGDSTFSYPYKVALASESGVILTTDGRLFGWGNSVQLGLSGNETVLGLTYIGNGYMSFHGFNGSDGVMDNVPILETNGYNYFVKTKDGKIVKFGEFSDQNYLKTNINIPIQVYPAYVDAVDFGSTGNTFNQLSVGGGPMISCASGVTAGNINYDLTSLLVSPSVIVVDYVGDPSPIYSKFHIQLYSGTGGSACNIGYPISEVQTLNIKECEINYPHIRFSWLNTLGGRDFYNFTEYFEETFDQDSETYSKDPNQWSGSTWNLTPWNSGSRIYSKNITRKITVTTDWLTLDQVEYIKGMFSSPQVNAWLPNQLYPTLVVLDTSSFSVKKQVNEKMVSVTFTCTLSLPDRVQNT